MTTIATSWIDETIENLRELIEKDILDELDTDMRADLISGAFVGIPSQEKKTLRNGVFGQLSHDSVDSVVNELCLQLENKRAN